MQSGPLTTTGAVLAALAVAAILVSGPSVRFGWWHFRVGLLLFAIALPLGLAAIVLLVIGLTRGEGIAATWIVGAVLALVAVALPARGLAIARKAPAIHDVTTDTADPPRFSAIAARHETPDEETIAKQRAAYPDLGPILIDDPPGEAFQRALEAVRAQGWDVAAANQETGTIEATDTTFWFGFKDDVVIRVRPEGSGSRIDLRSVSRVGRSDVGANAARIRRFRDSLR
ncbi:MAG: DUF1499 domain-containing protein [Thermoanaerobaculia bacterium]